MKVWFTSIICCLLSIALIAQEEQVAYDSVSYSRLTFVEPSIGLSIAQGNFARKLEDDQNLAFSLAMLFQLKPEKPAFMGFNFRYTEIDRYSLDWDGFFDNGDPAEFEGVAVSSILSLAALGRYYPGLSFGPVELYVEGRVGVRLMMTTETITSYFDGIEEDSEIDVANSDFGLLYGGTVGLHTRLTNMVYFNTKITYAPGTSAMYDARRPIDQIGPLATPVGAFEVQQSATSMIALDIGVTIVF